MPGSCPDPTTSSGEEFELQQAGAFHWVWGPAGATAEAPTPRGEGFSLLSCLKMSLYFSECLANWENVIKKPYSYLKQIPSVPGFHTRGEPLCCVCSYHLPCMFPWHFPLSHCLPCETLPLVLDSALFRGIWVVLLEHLPFQKILVYQTHPSLKV